ncbi:telomere zinc finger-associated protein isoform X2 [Brienomyrus brachyistius]|uniref:telomere zinc finger-associated protein isoform X2 n=1 Tax=Brienomyrus brachyistius TaxID=42636 RepID=UPI0020B39DCD|nr:telomere zinc finger-associated protein isoform X2 [Brienomyrus brachyistius]
MAPLENTHAERLLFSLNQQRALGRFCDAILNTGSGKCYTVHRNVLACFSEIFQNACPTSTSHMEYCLPDDCSSEGLELLLDFVYTGKLELDSANLEKVQRAAMGLSIQDALRICQEFASNMTCPKGPQDPKHGKGGGDEEHSHGASPQNTSKPDVPIKGNPRLRLKSKSRPKVCNSVPRQLTVTTTTRSGRRVKGPIRLLRESPTPPDTRMREPMSVERGPGGAEGSGQNFEQAVNESEVYQKEQLSNDIEDEDCGEVDGQHEDTDDEYMPHSLAGIGPAPQQVKRRRRRKAISKENGEQAGGDPKRGSVQCPTCQKTFFSKYYLKVHNRRHTGEKPFECSKCGKCYYRKENLLEHEARNCLRRTEVFSCSMCPMTFQRRLELRLHTVTHTGEMPNKCSSCPEQFMQKKDLKIHLIKVHGAPKPHACSLCPKCFLSRTELRLHEASKHRGEKLFVCEECGHRASSRNGLQMHIKAIHRNERPFVCEFCNHAFTQKANLNMHLRTHTGEKPFQCHLCGKTFRTQASLDKHHRTHTGERPFHCEFCEQRFTEKGPLLRHVASKHQEGRPHYCHICTKTFKAIEQLRVHVRRHKGMRKFECTECGYKFTRQAHLRRHSQIHNRVENYNPRQRRLRNVVVDEEKATVASPPPDGDSQPTDDVISVMIQPDTIVVEEVVASQGTGPMEEGEAFNVADVMDQALLAGGTYPIHHPVVELPDDGTGDKN